MQFKRNMSTADQIFRTTMGVGLIYLGPFSDILTTDLMSGILLAIVGFITIISSAIGYCPLYHVAGFCTYKPSQDDLDGEDTHQEMQPKL